MDTDIKNKIWSIFESEKKNICVCSHTSPDGDAVGSALAMKLMLDKFGHSVSVIVPNSFPEYYSWLPNSDKIIIAQKNTNTAKDVIEKADILVFVDLNCIKRVEGIVKNLKEKNCPKILFDHHEYSGENFDYSLSRTNVSSTCELIYEFFIERHKNLIDKDIASCIYTGIVTDTGGFFHGNMNTNTFIFVSQLIEKKIDIIKLNQLIYNTFSESRLRLLGHCISNKLEIVSGTPAAYMSLSISELNNFGYKDGDTEGIVNYGLSLKNVKVCALFIEKEHRIKISFRSEGNYDVNSIAMKYFNGGGHKNASGAYFNGKMDDAIALYVKAVKEI